MWSIVRPDYTQDDHEEGHEKGGHKEWDSLLIDARVDK